MKNVKIKYLLPVFIVVSGTIAGQNPITLNNSNMPGGGDTLRYTDVQMNSVTNYMQTGANFTWDFSKVTDVAEGVRSFKLGAQTPYAFLFASSYGEKIADSLGAGPLQIKKYYNFY